jgi:hypothetical protein
VRFPRADLQSAPGRLRASCPPVLWPVRGVLPLGWDRKARVTPVRTASQETWPGAEPRGQSLGESRGGAPKGERAVISARPCSAEYGHGRCAFSALRLLLFLEAKDSWLRSAKLGRGCVARTRSLAPSVPAKRGTTGVRAASEPSWRGRWTWSFVVVAEDSVRKRKRANMFGHHEDSCGALSPAPPPPPCFAGWSPSPAIAVADEARPLSRGRMKRGAG